ncbi:hypothetical protein FHX57_007360 [Paraburkholderia tropica]|uniref:Uncharacterized protein n=1 Tax=Paraburkholderia tropica TaxID=92647 RepID=A0ABX5MD03_9BURK|nr:hypothetical protein [Paraburkholderia tropica]MBB2984229.1 hypothetical protein [Paraburkholderia tropica]MBB3004973.1 hypothetical protein [Paraburkholderia tropica]MBB6323261.1 hypothetical protein [Paraburkholderia tropica]PXX05059.1 hypothetical protein C7400_14425 [Paraburkholderia tropica]PZW70487.1 hypothetical protein C7399_14425 [Paraburkholderia tropica]
MSLTTTLIAKLSGLDEAHAARVLLSVRAQDDLQAPPPAEFGRGRPARAWALAVVMSRNPVRFWVGMSGLIAFPVYLLCEIGAWLHG